MNKIRNKIVHSREESIDSKELAIIKAILAKCLPNRKTKEEIEHIQDFSIICLLYLNLVTGELYRFMEKLEYDIPEHRRIMAWLSNWYNTAVLKTM